MRPMRLLVTAGNTLAPIDRVRAVTNVFTGRPDAGAWESDAGPPSLGDRSAGKVKSDQPELWLRLVKAPKLVDRVRADWGFRGVLVKFKLEVGVGEDELLRIAERSRVHSGADL